MVAEFRHHQQEWGQREILHTNELYENRYWSVILDEMLGVAEFRHTNELYENRVNLSNELKGIYIHRLIISFDYFV